MQTVDQRTEALQLANTIRRANKEFKDTLRSTPRVEGVELVAGALRDLDSYSSIKCLRIEVVMKAIRGIGAARAQSLLVRAHVAPTRRVGALSARQVDAIANELELYVQTNRRSRHGS